MKRRNVLCFGDSNTHGYDSKTGGRFGEDIRWTSLLSDKLKDEYYIIEEGLSGRTCVTDDNLNEGLSGISVLRAIMMSHEPIDLLIIMLGTNDTKERFSYTPENIALGLRRLCMKAIHIEEAWRDGKPEILIITPPPIEKEYIDSEVGGNMGRGCDEKSRKLAPIFKDLSCELGLHYLDANEIPGMEIYPYDYMHLSPKGHKALADALQKLIPKILN